MDVATLGIRVVYDDVTKANNAVVALAASGENAGRKMTAAFAPLPKAMQDTQRAMQPLLTGFQQFESVTGAVVELGRSVNNVATTTNAASAGLTKLNAPLRAMAVNVLQLNPQVAQFSSILGGLALGAGPMVGVLAGVAALSFAWKKLTEDARAAKEEHKKLLEVLDDLVNKEKFSIQKSYDANVSLLGSLVSQRAGVAQSRVDLQAARGGGPLGTFVEMGFSSRLGELDKDIAKVKARVESGTREIEKVYRDSTARQAEERKRAQDKEIADLKRHFDEYSRIAKEREDKAFDDAQRQALFGRVDARGIPGVRDPIRMGGSLTYSPSVARVTPSEDALKKARELTDQIQQQARLTEQVASSAIDLAQAFGLAGQNVAQIARGVVQMAASLGPLRDAMSRRDKQTGSGAEVLLAALPVIGGFTSAVGGIVSIVNGQREAAREMKAAAEAFRASVDDWAAENAGSGASSVAGINRRRQGLLANAGISSSDADYLRGADLDTLRGSVRAAAEYRKSIVAEIDALFKDAIAIARHNLMSSVGEEFNALAGPGGDYLNAQNEIIRKYIEQRDAAIALGASLDDLLQIETLRERKLADLVNTLEQSATSSLLGRLGINSPAAAPFLGDSKNGQWFAAFEKYVSGIEASNKRVAEETERNNFYAGIQNAIAQRQLDTAQQSLRAQEDIAKGLRDTIDALRNYSDSLKLSSLSPLSSAKRYAAAESQFEALVTKAFGGDQDAARAITSGGGNAFLQESVARFGGSARRSQDYNRVQSVVSGLEGMFGSQLAAQDPVLEELKKQTAIAQAQLGTQQDTLVQQLVQRATDHGDEAGRIIGILRGMGYTLGMDSPGGSPTGKYYALPYTPLQGPASSQAAYDDYQAAHGYAADLMTYSEWLTAGKPAYASGTRFHRGGPALVGERGAELVNMPRGSSVSTSEQFGRPIVDEIRALRRDVHELMRAQTSAIQSSGEKARAAARRN